MRYSTAHRPWPVPSRRWVMGMKWHDLMFMHWAVPAEALRPLVPGTLELDTFDGQAWIGVVPFRMSGVRPRLFPPLPGLSAFPELNVRTYVTAGGRPGVWFFSLDASNQVAVRTARWTFHLNYYDAKMHCDPQPGGEIRYRSVRTHKGAPPAEFAATYRPTGPVFEAAPGSLDHFLVERYCLYAAAPDGRTYRGDIAHDRWPLQKATAEVTHDTMVQPLGLDVSNSPPLLHFAKYLEVVAWRPRRI